MGTRNLTCVVLDNEMRVAQYCQWDGYPDGQGADVCKFIQHNDMGLFREQVGKVRPITQEQLQAKWVECGMTPGSDWVDYEVSTKFKETYPHLHRDYGAKILRYILFGGTDVNLDPEFGEDSLFCEWAYVVDLDREVVEVYEGFVKEAHDKGRWADGKPSAPSTTGDVYYPIELTHEVPFADIKERGEEALLSLFPKEEEEETEEANDPVA